MTVRTSGIVLAGGRSVRMGTPKALLDLGGRPILTHVAEALHGVCDELVLSVGVDQVAPSELVDRLREAVVSGGWRQSTVVRDRERDRGPIAGLAAALEAARGTVAFVTACDTPFLSPELVRGLLRRAGRSDRPDLVLPVYGGHEQPLLAVYRVKTMFAHFARQLAGGGGRPTDELAHCRVVRIGEEELHRLDPSDLSFTNLNDPDDYRRARRVGFARTTPERSEG